MPKATAEQAKMRMGKENASSAVGNVGTVGSALSGMEQANNLPQVDASLKTSEEARKLKQIYKPIWDYYARPNGDGFLAFLQDLVFTKDEEANEALGEEVVKRFPVTAYIRYVVKYALFGQRLIAVPKSRRMLMTWLMAAYALWTAMFNRNRNVLWQAQTGKKSAHTLEEKILFILERIPSDRIEPFVNESEPSIPMGWTKETVNYYKTRRDPNGLVELTFMVAVYEADGTRKLERNSSIYALPEGKDQWRQFTVSLGIIDEGAFFVDLQSSLRGALPAVGQKGQLIVVSSANPGYMADLIAQPDAEPNTPAPPQPTPFFKGIRTWMSRNGYFVCWLHYTADENKRGIEWEQWPDPSVPNSKAGEARKGYEKRDWNSEMEIDFSVHQGQPFYPQFSRAMHVHQLKPIFGAPLILGFDFGLTPSTVICQLLPTGHLMVLREFTSEGVGIVQHARDLQVFLNTEFPWWWSGRKLRNSSVELGFLGETYERPTVTSYCDPAGMQRVQTDATTVFDILRELQFNPQPAEQTPVARSEAVRTLLTTLLHINLQGEVMLPCLLVDQSCKLLIESLSGGCKVAKGTGVRKEKNRFSHIVEALEYTAVELVSGTKLARTGSRRPLGR
jgi:hypothetical protein